MNQELTDEEKESVKEAVWRSGYPQESWWWHYWDRIEKIKSSSYQEGVEAAVNMATRLIEAHQDGFQENIEDGERRQIIYTDNAVAILASLTPKEGE